MYVFNFYRLSKDRLSDTFNMFPNIPVFTTFRLLHNKSDMRTGLFIPSSITKRASFLLQWKYLCSDNTYWRKCWNYIDNNSRGFILTYNEFLKVSIMFVSWLLPQKFLFIRYNVLNSGLHIVIIKPNVVLPTYKCK